MQYLIEQPFFQDGVAGLNPVGGTINNWFVGLLDVAVPLSRER
jgi:hypothetical protein